MDNCRGFMDGLINEFQHHLYTKNIYLRQATILEIADRIVEFADRNDTEQYFYFIINACPYAETFEAEHRMTSYISKMEMYFNRISDKFSKAVYFMCKAAFVKLFGDDNTAAIKFTRTAQKLVPDVISGDKEYSQREISLCYNIYNNFGMYYLFNKDFDNSRKSFKKVMQICQKYKIPIEEYVTLLNNLQFLSTVEMNGQKAIELNKE